MGRLRRIGGSGRMRFRYTGRPMSCAQSRSDQLSLLRRLREQANASRRPAPKLSFAVVLSARARLRTGRSCGPDGCAA
eukprot:8196438-Pyramimonas_sp.AAC.1